MVSYLWNAHIIWRKPKKAKLLIYDRISCVEILEKYIPFTSYEVLDTRGESINIYVIFKVLLNWQKNSVKTQYINQYIEIVSPNAVVTFIDNDISFYQLSSSFPEITFISIQNGVRGPELFKLLSKEKLTEFKVDYLLCFNEAIGKQYEQYISGKIEAIGSFKNNHFNSVNTKKENSLVFISQYREKKAEIIDTSLGFPLLWEDHFMSEKFLLILLKRYCSANNIKFLICGVTTIDDGPEFNFYKDLLGNTEWEFVPRDDKNLFSSYELISSSKFCVFINSTLGYEAFARGYRVAGFSLRSHYQNIPEYKFGWPADLSDNGAFWTNNPDEKEVERVLDYVTKVSDEEWRKTYLSFLPKIMNYNQGNTRYIQILEEIGVVKSLEKKE